MALRRSLAWIDAGGRTRQTFLTSSGGASSTQSALLGVSNADWLQWFEGILHTDLSPSPLNVAYPDVADFAALLYADAGGNQTTVVVPAPSSGIFMADQVTVNPAAIAAVTTAVTSELITSAGGAVTTYLGGIRRRSTP